MMISSYLACCGLTEYKKLKEDENEYMGDFVNNVLECSTLVFAYHYCGIKSNDPQIVHYINFYCFDVLDSF